MSLPRQNKPNNLIHESSPYLLQHAYNPVQWLPFSDEAFNKAAKEDKPVLISIGYSACHWCHVMEHESFEDDEVAALMNEHFVCIKVDREERNDVDNLYMQAVQMLTGHGGWPLNCFVMPDGRPFYGGTYFPKSQWMNILTNLSALWKQERPKVTGYAHELTKGIKKSEELLTVEKASSPINKELLRDSILRWKKRMDNTEGGPNKAPKFPLPSNYLFLLRYSFLENDKELQAHVELTLRKMAFGGIYDQLHGGFCRYSTDILWKVPHFEKMLYDNSQLVSLYTEAFVLTNNELYKEIALNTLDFVTTEWYNVGGYFYSAYDADSDGEEGKYYVWTKNDLMEILGDNYEVFSKYFLINEKGYWEHDNYILMRNENVTEVLTEFNITKKNLEQKINQCKEQLKNEALSRLKPGLDDKTITSWNALMCTAYAKAYLAFGKQEHREIALKSAKFLMTKMYVKGEKFYRTFKNGIARIDGFLEDYVFTAEALLNCYLLNADEKFLYEALEITELALKNFNNPKSDLLYYTSSETSQLVARTSEIADNVMPSSNSQMAMNLFLLARYFGKNDWNERAQRMVSLVGEEMRSYGSAYSNWGTLALNFEYPFREIAIVGKNVDDLFVQVRQQGLTNTIFAISAGVSNLALTKDRYVEGKTFIYMCENNSCKLPVDTVEEALAQIS